MRLPINYEETHYTVRRQAREQYAKQQNGMCWHCGGKLTQPSLDYRRINPSRFPPTMFKYPVHLHHDRTTGMTIGAVHAHCNAVLWQYHGE